MSVRGLMTLVVALLLVEAGLLWMPAGLPASTPWLRQFSVPLDEVASVSQTMRVDAPGFEGVTIAAERVGEVGGSIRARVVATGEAARTVVDRVIPANELVAHGRYTLPFEAQADSRGLIYRLDLAPQPGTTTGVAIRAGRGDPESRGAMYVNGRERWADVVFQTQASGARLATRLGARLADIHPGLPWGAAAAWLGLHALVPALGLAAFRVVSANE